MQPILVFPHGVTLAHLVRPLLVGQKLSESGYDVIYFTSGPFTQLVKETGLPTEYVVCEDPTVGLGRLKAMEKGQIGPLRYYREATKTMREYIDQEVQILRKYQPLAVLTDARPTLRISCELTNTPLITLANYFVCDQLFPFGFIQRFFCRYIGLPFNLESRRRGLKWVGDISKYLNGDLTLVPDLGVYSGAKDVPGKFVQIGPLLWEPVVEAPDWLEELSGKETIYVSLGNSALEGAAQSLIEALGDTPYQVVFSTHGLSEKMNWPDNFYRGKLLPGRTIAAVSDLVICQGGNGTVYQALSVGTPLLCIPDLADQKINSERVRQLGVGDYLSKSQLKKGTILNAVRGILDNQSYRNNARHFKSIINSENAPSLALEEIRKFLSVAPQARKRA